MLSLSLSKTQKKKKWLPEIFPLNNPKVLSDPPSHSCLMSNCSLASCSLSKCSVFLSYSKWVLGVEFGKGWLSRNNTYKEIAFRNLHLLFSSQFSPSLIHYSAKSLTRLVYFNWDSSWIHEWMGDGRTHLVLSSFLFFLFFLKHTPIKLPSINNQPQDKKDMSFEVVRLAFSLLLGP